AAERAAAEKAAADQAAAERAAADKAAADQAAAERAAAEKAAADQAAAERAAADEPARGRVKLADTVRPKYAKIRPDQWGALDRIARELMDARTRIGGPRITSNTLIRIAIDALVATEGSLTGNHETEVRARYFKELGIRNSQIPGDQDS
ncbi:hypothetical protein, partial [Streptomyces fildesensis]|uniref:hypothetical protein n=1 Tax=Streptomyces fildesensis TaxID=375757 RepID=UPI0018E029FC